MRWMFVLASLVVLVSCGTPSGSNLRSATAKLKQVTTLEQARTVYAELIAVPETPSPLDAQDQNERDEFRTASVRILKTFGRDPVVKEAYAKFSSTQSSLAEILP